MIEDRSRHAVIAPLKPFLVRHILHLNARMSSTFQTVPIARGSRHISPTRTKRPLPPCCPALTPVTLPPPSAPSALRYLREYRRLAVGTADVAWPSSPLRELLRTAQQQERAGAATIPDDGGREARTGASMMGLIGHALSAEERGFPVAAAGGVLGTANGSSVRKDTPVPPWLLMAMVSASQNQGTGGGSEAVGGMGAPPSFAGGDPATAATEVGLRNALERRVEGSLRSLNSVRALLQDPAGSARQGAADSGSGSGSRSGADDEAVARLAALTADVDPATALFESTLREWLACRQRGKGGGDGDGDGEQYGPRHHGGSRFGGAGMRDSGLGWGGGGGSRAVANDDDLVLAFRCEAAGDAEAMVSENVSLLQVALLRCVRSFALATCRRALLAARVLATDPVLTFCSIPSLFVCGPTHRKGTEK